MKRVYFFPTIRRTPEKNGLHEGEHFAVINSKRCFGKNLPKLYPRLVNDVMSGGYIGLSVFFAKEGIHLIGQGIVAGRTTILIALGLQAYVALKHLLSENRYTKFETEDLLEGMEKISEFSHNVKLAGDNITHVAITRYGGKTFFLTKKAAAVLRLLKRGKPIARILGNK